MSYRMLENKNGLKVQQIDLVCAYRELFCLVVVILSLVIVPSCLFLGVSPHSFCACVFS